MESRERKPWHEALIERFANPMDKGSVSTFCSENSIARATYYKYLKLHREEVFKEADLRRKKYYSELRAMAFEALARRMGQSDKALQMVLEMTGDYTPKQEVQYSSATEKRARLESLMEKLAKDYKTKDIKSEDA